MGAMDHQLMVKDESTYGTAVTPDRTYEYESESIEEAEGRTEGDPLRVGSGFIRSDRFTPYFVGASGTLQRAVMTKGEGWWLKHMLGGTATTGPAETVVYTHTGTEGSLVGDCFTMQLNRPFHPSGTNQAFTYEGGKITEWTLSNSVDGNLLLDTNLDFEQVKQATALATASYPSGMENFAWTKGAVTIGGVAFDLTEISISVNNGLNVDRRQIRGNSDKKEPTSSRRSGTFAIKADFESMTQRLRARAQASADVAPDRASALGAIVATWTGPTLLGSTLYPEYKVTIPAARFDVWKAATEGPDALEQELSGEIRYDGSNSPVTVAIKNADSTA